MAPSTIGLLTVKVIVEAVVIDVDEYGNLDALISDIQRRLAGQAVVLTGSQQCSPVFVRNSLDPFHVAPVADFTVSPASGAWADVVVQAQCIAVAVRFWKSSHEPIISDGQNSANGRGGKSASIYGRSLAVLSFVAAERPGHQLEFDGWRRHPHKTTLVATYYRAPNFSLKSSRQLARNGSRCRNLQGSDGETSLAKMTVSG